MARGTREHDRLAINSELRIPLFDKEIIVSTLTLWLASGVTS